MRVLAFDSTGPVLTVGLARDAVALGRWDAGAERAKSNLLEGLIDHALAAVDWSRQAVEGLALVTGPGSLTATRIGWATATGWAQAMGIPIAGWPTPVVHYRRWKESGGPHGDEARMVCCLIHHRGDAFYCYRFSRHDPPGTPEAVVLGQWPSAEVGSVRVIGPGLLGYRERWHEAAGERAELAGDDEAVVGGDTLALWGEADLLAGRTLPVDQSPLDYGLPPDFRRVEGR